MSKVNNKAPIVNPKNGVVAVQRPDDVEVQLTASAAVDTAVKLLDAAAEAEGDRLITEEMQTRSKRDQADDNS